MSDIHIHVHVHDGSDPRVTEILDRLDQLTTQETQNMSDLTARLSTLQAEVAEQTTVNASAVTLLTNLTSNLQAVRDDLAARGVTDEQLAALDGQIASYSTNTDALAAAVAANTPAEDDEDIEPTDPTPVDPDPAPVDPTDPVDDGTTPA